LPAFYKSNKVIIINGDALETLKKMPSESVDCCVTSPPYFGLRDYGVNGQIGLEKTPEEYIKKCTEVFMEVYRILYKNGTLWLNIGDSYASGTCGRDDSGNSGRFAGVRLNPKKRFTPSGFKQKDMIGIPWTLAFALRVYGWYLRQDIIWSKPNTMPEPVRDRCVKAHEYIFLLSKSKKYYFDYLAVQEPAVSKHKSGNGFLRDARLSFQNVDGSFRGNNKQWLPTTKRNLRDVWTINTKPYKGAHFATFPIELVERCILAGCKKGGVVLDPFLGSGTTAYVAQKLNRKCIGIELNTEYCRLAKNRILDV